MNTMNLELRGVKYAAFASEETACFEATLYADGKPVVIVSNDGHGGCDDYAPIRGDYPAMRVALDRLSAHVATLPEEDVYGTMMKPTLEMVVARLLDQYLMAKDLRAKLKRYVLFTKANEAGIFQIKAAAASAPGFWERFAVKYPGAVVLNRLSEAEALAVYGRAA